MFERNCPSPAELSGFILGTLSLPGLEGVARHLDACSVCEAAVDALERLSDPVMAAVRHPGAGSSVQAGHPHAIGGPHVPDRLGDFRVIREVGRGGMGIVYEAEQISLGRRVALKVLPHQSLLEPESVERFRREARAVAGLHHTNIVQVFGTGEQDGLHYFVMELIPGVGLDRVLRELKRGQPDGQPAPAGGPGGGGTGDPSLLAVVRGLLSGISSGREAEVSASADGPTAQPAGAEAIPLAPSSASGSGRPYWVRVARVGLQVAEALAHAHALGVVHRDIKPSNLLLDYRGTVWVTDFGLAKAADEDNVLTRSGDIIGTLRYLPPEALEGRSDARGDVYSLGVTLYELATLRDAFPDVDRNVLVRRKLDAELARPRRVNEAVPRDLETIILKATARDPGHRYWNAAGLAADLRRFVEDRPVHARRITPPERLWRWCRRDPRTAGLLGRCWWRSRWGSWASRRSGDAPSRRHATRPPRVSAPIWPRSRPAPISTSAISPRLGSSGGSTTWRARARARQLRARATRLGVALSARRGPARDRRAGPPVAQHDLRRRLQPRRPITGLLRLGLLRQ